MTPPLHPLVMGILNVTPDSFSDGGRYLDAAAAIAHGERLIAEGADVLDIGGESTRPGADPVDAAEEIGRVIPVIAALAGRTRISVDTMKPAVARAAVAAGATIWNDVAALAGSPESLSAAAELGCGVVLMHMQGDPRTMQVAPDYDDVVAEVAQFLDARAQAAVAAGVAPARIWLDPGIGFGKTRAHNLELLAHLDWLTALGFPVLVGASRKSFIEHVAGDGSAGRGRLGGSVAAALAAVRAGAAAVRVHDVAATVQALAVERAIAAARSDV